MLIGDNGVEKYRVLLYSLRCTIAQIHGAYLIKQYLSMEEILGTLKGATAFVKWAQEIRQGKTDP